MMDLTVPTGSPLSNARYPSPVSAPTPFTSANLNVDQLATPSLLPDGSGLRALPKPPPTKKPSIWDKEHISETLADIGAGFFASQNFGDGFGVAAQTIAGRTRKLRENQRPDITYGGPGDQFEITTNKETGERSIREVPEFRAANDRVLTAKNKPDPKVAADLRGRALYAIATQVPPERRAEAYRNLITNPEQFGVDTTGMPAEWSDDYGTLGGMMGLTVDQSLSQERNNNLAKSVIEDRKVKQAQGAARVEQGAARVQQGAATVQQGATRVQQSAQRLRTPPAGIRRGVSTPTTKAQFDALPSGTRFMAPDGSYRIKP